MYSKASSAASGSTSLSSEADRKTVACSTASSSGWTPNSAGISGKTPAPSGTSRLLDLAMSAPGHGGNDAHLVAVFDRGGEVVEVADIFIIHIDVDEPPHLAVLEDTCRDAGALLP